jgi:cysteinyl-tRNA synthetase
VAALCGIVSGRSEDIRGFDAGTLAVDNPSDRDVSAVPALSSVHSVADVCERCLDQFEAAMCDDLNGPRAVAALFQLVGAAEALSSRNGASVNDAQAILESTRKMDEVFGVLYEVPTSYVHFAAGAGAAGADVAGSEESTRPVAWPEVRREAEELAGARVRLKLLKQYQEADALRERIKALGFGVRDVADGFELFDLPTE